MKKSLIWTAVSVGVIGVGVPAFAANQTSKPQPSITTVVTHASQPATTRPSVTIEDSVKNTIDDHGVDATTNTIDDHGVDATTNTIDDHGVDATTNTIDDHGVDATTNTIDDSGHHSGGADDSGHHGGGADDSGHGGSDD